MISKQKEKNLIRRYLVWCYKTTKEELDRIDRKFTQVDVDRKVLKELVKGVVSAGVGKNAYLGKIKEFENYITKKEKDANIEKYVSVEKKQVQSNYFYLTKRLGAIEKSVISFLGSKELRAIESAYEEEMTRRILESREH
jgi:hypothetical protein